MATSTAPKSLLRPMTFPRKLLLGPGPSNVSPRVAAACALPLLGHMHPEFVQVGERERGGSTATVAVYACLIFGTQRDVVGVVSGPLFGFRSWTR